MPQSPKPKKRRTKTQEERLPYWPSPTFMEKSMKLALERGWKGTDDELNDRIIIAYRIRRAEILADEAMERYETA